MRLEATIPESRATAVVELANELGLSRSQVVDEALSLFLKVVLEVKKGRRLVTSDPHSADPACELVTPTLSALEWAMTRERVTLAPSALAKLEALAKTPPTRNPRLAEAVKRHRR